MKTKYKRKKETKYFTLFNKVIIRQGKNKVVLTKPDLQQGLEALKRRGE